jgi:hypothetical protein
MIKEEVIKHLMEDSTKWLDLSAMAEKEYHSDMELIKKLTEAVE